MKIFILLHPRKNASIFIRSSVFKVIPFSNLFINGFKLNTPSSGICVLLFNIFLASLFSFSIVFIELIFFLGVNLSISSLPRELTQ